MPDCASSRKKSPRELSVEFRSWCCRAIGHLGPRSANSCQGRIVPRPLMSQLPSCLRTGSMLRLSFTRAEQRGSRSSHWPDDQLTFRIDDFKDPGCAKAMPKKGLENANACLKINIAPPHGRKRLSRVKENDQTSSLVLCIESQGLRRNPGLYATDQVCERRLFRPPSQVVHQGKEMVFGKKDLPRCNFETPM